MKGSGLVIGLVVTVLIACSMIPLISAIANPDDDNDLDVFIVAGQSNTYPKINANPTTSDPIPEPGMGYYFGTESDPTYNETFNLSECAMYDLNDGSDGARIGGIYPPFAAQYSEKTGHKVYLIDTGLSGQTLSSFLPGESNWDHVYNVIDYGMKAIPSGYDVNVMGYIWIQGEGDSSTPIQTYETRMIELYDAYSTGELPVKLPTCYVCKVRSVIETDTVVNSSDAQIYLCDNVEGFVMGSELAETFTVGNGLVGSDDLHYTQAGFNALGVDLGNNIAEHLSRSDGWNAGELISLVPVFIVLAIIVVSARLILVNKDD